MHCNVGTKEKKKVNSAKRHGILRIFIDPRLILYALRSRGVAECAQRLIIVVINWTDAGTHHCLGVAAKGVLLVGPV